MEPGSTGCRVSPRRGPMLLSRGTDRDSRKPHTEAAVASRICSLNQVSVGLLVTFTWTSRRDLISKVTKTQETAKKAAFWVKKDRPGMPYGHCVTGFPRTTGTGCARTNGWDESQHAMRVCLLIGASEGDDRLDGKSRMRREAHIRFREGVEVQLPAILDTPSASGALKLAGLLYKGRGHAFHHRSQPDLSDSDAPRPPFWPPCGGRLPGL